MPRNEARRHPRRVRSAPRHRDGRHRDRRVGRLWIGKARIRKLRIDELEIGQVTRLDEPGSDGQ